MQTGINADQNFYPKPRRLSSEPEHHQHHPRIYDPPALPDLQARSPPLPPNLPSLTTQHLQAVTANACAQSGLNGGDPDEFYRDFRGLPTNGHNPSPPAMEAPMSDSRPPQSSLKPPGNGITSKHPSVSQARTALKPSYRSASNPLDDRVLGNAKSTTVLNGLSSTGKPSVKDLLKRFDQNNDQAGPAAVRKAAPRIIPRDVNGPGYLKERGYQARATAPNVAVRPPGTATREPGRSKSPLKMQRARFAPDEQQSTTGQSSPARKPQTLATTTIPQASKSVTNLSPTSPNSSVPPTRKPLFGEVLPTNLGTPNIAYGISRATPRRTSDSSLHPTLSSHRRGRSELDVAPSSPTAWYLGVTPTFEDVNTHKPRSSPGHNRSHSDFRDMKVNTLNGVKPSFQISKPQPTSAVQPPQSRLPMPSATPLSHSADLSSLPTPRANSPFATMTLSNGKARKPEQRPWSPEGRSITPSNRERTPLSSPRGKVRNLDRPVTNNASLKAYISAPLPKKSPPLRSSRPRLPVSSASNENTRPKSDGTPASPQPVGSGMRIIRRNHADTNEAKTRAGPGVPMTKEDFSARRDDIQRAYTKSIHETEQKRIRADNLRRLHERQAARSSIPLQASQATAKDVDTPIQTPPEEPRRETRSPPLHINTSLQRLELVQQNLAEGQDSPTLGMPGTFLGDDDEAPPSAISNATGTTEIENEPQTEAARLCRVPSQPSASAGRADYSDDHLSLEQAFIRMQNSAAEAEQENFQMMLDAIPVEEPQPEATPTNEVFARSTSPPGTPHEAELPVSTSGVTVASRQGVCPGYSSAATALADPSEGMSDGHGEPQVMPEESKVSGVCPETPEISHPDEPVEVPRIQLPNLHAALAPSDNGQDCLNTPITDLCSESSDGVGQTSSAEQEGCEQTCRIRDSQGSPQIFHSGHPSWRTDYSVGIAHEFSATDDSPYPAIFEPEQKPVPPPKDTSPAVPPKPDGYNPHPSPHLAGKAHLHSDPARNQLLPVSSGAGLGLGLTETSAASDINITAPLRPDYSPPPPPEAEDLSAAFRRPTPPSNQNNRRSLSCAYQSSLSGNQNLDSGRASDDLDSPRASISTLRSSTQVSFDDANNDSKANLQSDLTMTDEEKAAAEATRKRLFKRMMSIKELIDTEAIYIKDMNVVEEIYKGTAEACPKLDPSDIKTIFRNTNEIVEFSTMFLDELKLAASSIYSPRKRSRSKANGSPPSTERYSVATTLNDETDDQKDRKTFIGMNFGKHLQPMQAIYTEYLKNSELANARLTALQADSAVKVWLSECNSVAKDLTGAWDLDALLVKPVQRITRYQLFMTQIRESTPLDHPDYPALVSAGQELGSLLQNIDDLKKRIHMVGKIVGRKRKESDVRTGIAKAFGRRADKHAANPNRPPDDEAYVKCHEKFGDDYLRLQVILRDAEYQTREATNYVNNNLRLFSSMELFMRLGATSYPEIESKWVHFNMSMRDVGTVGLEDHVAAVRKQVIEPVEKIISLYGPPSLAIKKRNKRRLDYEKSLCLKSSGKKIDERLAELVAQYEALNETLKIELPRLSSLTNTIGQICSTRLLYVQSEWWGIWQAKLAQNLEEGQKAATIEDIADMFHRDFKYSEAKIQEFGIINGSFGTGMSTRPSPSAQDEEYRKGRPSNLSSRSRGISFNSDISPSLPTPDFAKRHSGQFTFSPLLANAPGLPLSVHQPHSFSNSHSTAGSGSPSLTPDTASSSRYHASASRPSTSRSQTSDTAGMRQSNDYNSPYRRESGSTYNSNYIDGPSPSSRPFSGMFHSAMPLADGPEDSQRSSRASSRDRNVSGGYNILYLAASLFEFNISVTKSEAGYPYLTYSAGEIFDVIGEKGELWLAKNQDDPDNQVGWIWSKHFARLAAD
ncbi:RhoGEF domain-containing protein [Diplocarpon rosae]|nr:RhoGEF domain-containing protein [Diplocarpon rosae]